MSYSVRFRFRITNPSWETILISFIRRFIVPIYPLLRVMPIAYRYVKQEVYDFIVRMLKLTVVIMIGIFVMVSIFSTMFIVLAAALGWIE